MNHEVIKYLLGLSFVCLAALVWESRDDWEGDLNKKSDVIWRGLIGLFASVINYYLNQISVQRSFALSMATHFFVFDYVMGARFGGNKWFNYLGKKGVVDNLDVWRRLNPWARFILRLIVLGAAIIWYF